MFKVMYGSIFNKDETYMIDHLAIILNKDTGTIRYGDKYMHKMADKYKADCTKLREVGLSAMADDLIYFEFDRYEGVLSIEEVCIILNQLVYFSNSYVSLVPLLLQGDINTLKLKIIDYKEMQDVYKSSLK